MKALTIRYLCNWTQCLCLLLSMALPLIISCSETDSMVKLNSFQCEQDPYGGFALANGEIINTHDKLLYNLTAMAELRDANGKLVGTWSSAVTPNPLQPNQTAKFLIKTQYRVENGTCRIFLTNPVGKVVLKNREYKKIQIVGLE